MSSMTNVSKELRPPPFSVAERSLDTGHEQTGIIGMRAGSFGRMRRQ